MRTVYEASNAVEAHMLQGYLLQEGITTRVDGAYLQGAVGELPAQGFVRLVVEDEDYDRARAAIERWEATELSDSVPLPPKSSSKCFVAALMGLAIGVAGSYAFFRSPMVTEGIDHNRDGVLDERWVYASSGTFLGSRIDRNFDSKIDYVSLTNQQGEIETAESDDDFDGVFETSCRFKNGSFESCDTDTDNDSYPDFKTNYEYGVPVSVEYVNPNSGWPVRVEHYQLGKLKTADVDTDHDGKLDQRHTYSDTAEIIGTEVIALP
ncbi:MAG: DUF2007 domain-containing protein [Thiobacillus sp.]|nr:DUF2007 domain-containing protein [Thiobacillus sp.]